MTLDPRGAAPAPPDFESLRKRVTSCSDQPDCLPHSCRFNCAEVSSLLKEIGHLQAERLVLPMDTWCNDDGSIVIEGRRYTPDAEIVVYAR